MSRTAQRWMPAGGIEPLAYQIEPIIVGCATIAEWRLGNATYFAESVHNQALQTAHEIREAIAAGVYDAMLIECLNTRYPQTGAVYILDAGIIRPLRATAAERAALPTAADFLNATRQDRREDKCPSQTQNPQMRLTF